jgi:Protein of unknown function (DUF3352)
MRLSRVVLCVLAVTGTLVAAGCGGAENAAAVGAIPASASLAPADAAAFVTLNTDESSAQWKKADKILSLFPSARTGLTGAVADALSENGVTWADDVAPALGPEVVVVVTADKKPIFLTKPDDEAKLKALLGKSDQSTVLGEVDGWAAVAETQGELDAYAAAVERGTLETVDAFTQAMGALPEEALARGWVDVTSVSEAIPGAIPGAGVGDILPQSPSGSFDLGVESLSAAVSAEDDGVFLSIGVKTPKSIGNTHYEPKLFAKVPADAVAALSFGGSQGLFDSFRDKANLDGLSEQLDSVAGVSLESLFDAFSGEGLLYVRKGGELPEVTAVLSPRDAGKTFETIDTLLHTVAEEGDGTVTTGTEDGVAVSRLTIQGVTVSYGKLDDDTVIVSTGEEAIAAFRSGDDKLVDTDSFKQAADRVALSDKPTTGFVYVDIDGLIPFIEGLGGPDDIFATDAREVLKSLDSFILSGSSDGDLIQVSGFVRVNAAS